MGEPCRPAECVAETREEDLPAPIGEAVVLCHDRWDAMRWPDRLTSGVRSCVNSGDGDSEGFDRQGVHFISIHVRNPTQIWHTTDGRTLGRDV